MPSPLIDAPPDQLVIHAKCFHPSGNFTEFRKEDVEQSIPSRFESIVNSNPDRIAIDTGNERLTFRELNETANRLARRIIAEQRNCEKPIGLFFEKGVWLTAALLAVLKTGNVFVLLDPSFPKTRLSAIVQNSGMELLVTDDHYMSQAEEFIGTNQRILNVDSINTLSLCDDLGLKIDPGALSLILYTSGSTGEPKGVIQNHRNILHNIMLWTNTVHCCNEDRLSLLGAGTANAVFNSFLALLNGATLLPFDPRRGGSDRLAAWLENQEITVCLISSPLFRSLAETLTGTERFPRLRVLRLTGEAVYPSDVDLFKKFFPLHCILITALSSTESGILKTYFIDHDTKFDGKDVPIGYSMEDKEVFLLDDSGKEVAFNQIGEIGVRSRYLFPGYWRRSDLTRSKFLSDGENFEERVYLTGDLGCRLSDGRFLYKGRKDFRVKVRGYGVEPAEVERALLTHNSVKEAVVVATETETGEAQVIAYYTSHDVTLNSAKLRWFLRHLLPEYMIPSAFVMLDALALSASGKLDRQALPDPSHCRPELDVPYEAPRGPIELELAKIWVDVLRIDKVGIHDNFLDLGGHSLAAARVISRIIQYFQMEPSAEALFQSPTIAEMAAVITRDQLKRLDNPELSLILAELESLSDEQVEQFVDQENQIPKSKND